MTDSQARAALEQKDRTIISVDDQGILRSQDEAKVLLDKFHDDGICNLLVTEGALLATHWWLMTMASQKKVVYFGTLEAWELFKLDGQGHLYEFGRQARMQ